MVCCLYRGGFACHAHLHHFSNWTEVPERRVCSIRHMLVEKLKWEAFRSRRVHGTLLLDTMHLQGSFTEPVEEEEDRRQKNLWWHWGKEECHIKNVTLLSCNTSCPVSAQTSILALLLSISRTEQNYTAVRVWTFYTEWWGGGRCNIPDRVRVKNHKD